MIQKLAVVGPLQCNCWCLVCEKTNEVVLIDPGDEPSKILHLLQPEYKIKYLLHTHAHFDHFAATTEVKKTRGGTITLHKEDEPLWSKLKTQGELFGFEFNDPDPVEKFIEDAEVISFGEERLEVIHTPGHSPGSICLKLQTSEGHVYSGDTLFHRSVGRSDLWGGNARTLTRSIKDRLFKLEDEREVFPGHGPSTSIGEEKLENPFVHL